MQNNQFDLFVHDFDNNPESQKQLDRNRSAYQNQLQKILDLLMGGKALTVFSMYTIYKIGDPRRRIKELKDSGVQMSDKSTKTKGTKTWFMTPEQILENRKLKDGPRIRVSHYN